MVHVHYLNPFYTELMDDNNDYFLEFHDMSGLLMQVQSDVLQIFLNQRFDGLILMFDLNNLRSLISLRKHIKILNYILRPDNSTSDFNLNEVF
jgi:hypothetical protein